MSNAPIEHGERALRPLTAAVLCALLAEIGLLALLGWVSS
jgi:hypothetical protein